MNNKQTYLNVLEIMRMQIEQGDFCDVATWAKNLHKAIEANINLENLPPKNKQVYENGRKIFLEIVGVKAYIESLGMDDPVSVKIPKDKLKTLSAYCQIDLEGNNEPDDCSDLTMIVGLNVVPVENDEAIQVY